MGALKTVFERLNEFGLLLQQDRTLPNVVALVTGHSLNTSWWRHPKAQMIFEIVEQLSEHPDVITTKLVDGKVTFVHRRLWPALVAVGTALEEWQFRGLSPEALDLYRKTEKEGTANAKGRPAKELEQRLLVRSWQEHTASGRHQTVLEVWGNWAERKRLKPVKSVLEARANLEEAVHRFGGSTRQLPWARLTKSRG